MWFTLHTVTHRSGFHFCFQGNDFLFVPTLNPLQDTLSLLFGLQNSTFAYLFFSFLKPSTALTYFLYSVTVLLFPLATDPLHSAGDYQSYDPLSGQRAGSLGLERWVHWMRTSPSEIDQISGISSLTLEERSLLS